MIKYAFRLFTLCGTAEKYNQRKVVKNYPFTKLNPREKRKACPLQN